MAALDADRALPLALFACALLILTLANDRLGIVDGEAAHLEAATGYGRLIEAAHHEGLRSATRDDVAKELGTTRSFGVFPHGLAGLLWLALARHTPHPWLSELCALRLPALLASAAVPALVYLLARETLSQRWAFFAGLLAFLAPRWIVDGVSLGGGGPLVAASLLALLAQRVADRLGAWWTALLGGLAMGIALSQSFAPLLLFVVPLAQAFRTPASAEAEGGSFRLTRGTCGWLLVGAPVAYLCSPSWQPLGADVILAIFERTLSPVLGATRALGRLPEGLSPPRWQALEAVLIGVPSSTLAAALLAFGCTLRGVGRLPRAHADVVRWAGAHVALFLLWPALVPRALGSFPWAWQLAVPFLALAAAHGGWFLSAFLGRAGLVAAVLAAEPVASSFDLATAPAASGWLVRAPSAIRGLAPFDAAITGSLLPELSRLAADAPKDQPLRIYAPDISPETWEALRRYKRLPRGVVPVRQAEGADVSILTPGKPAPRGSSELVRKSRGARVLLTLSAQPGVSRSPR